MRKPLIFISHIHEEAPLAQLLERELQAMFLGGVSFFVSSDRQILRGGDDWLREIKEALGRTSLLLAIISPRSVTRTWINFEAGAGWLKGRVVPLCHSGLKPSQLSQPLQSLVGFDLHDSGDLRDLAELVGHTAELETPSAAWHVLAAKVADVVAEIGHAPPSPYGATPAWVFPRSGDFTALSAMAASLAHAKTMRVYSIGCNFFWSSDHLDLFEKRVMKGNLSAQICMADFSSEAIMRRLAEEAEHPIGVPGAEHLIRRLVRCETRVADQDRLAVKVFNHYPTYGTLAFDEELYCYPYGYRSLGNYSPTFYWKGRDPAARFFHDQFEAIWHDSRPARDVYG